MKHPVKPPHQTPHEAPETAQPSPAADVKAPDTPLLDAPESISQALQEARIAQLEAKAAMLTDVVQRLQAEFENYQKRVMREKEMVTTQEKARLLSGLLDFWESLSNACAHAPTEDQAGLGALLRQLESFLRREGIRPIEAIGKPFDPQLHDSMLTENDATKPDHMVLEELSKGFWMGDKVLRPAKVKINRRPEEQK